jgi:hypothetical protein
VCRLSKRRKSWPAGDHRRHAAACARLWRQWQPAYGRETALKRHATRQCARRATAGCEQSDQRVDRVVTVVIAVIGIARGLFEGRVFLVGLLAAGVELTVGLLARAALLAAGIKLTRGLLARVALPA